VEARCSRTKFKGKSLDTKLTKYEDNGEIRVSRFVLFAKYYQGDNDGGHAAHVEEFTVIFQLENIKESNHMEKFGLEIIIILKWILKRTDCEGLN
jgi:hypothetical protein